MIIKIKRESFINLFKNDYVKKNLDNLFIEKLTNQIGYEIEAINDNFIEISVLRNKMFFSSWRKENDFSKFKNISSEDNETLNLFLFFIDFEMHLHFTRKFKPYFKLESDFNYKEIFNKTLKILKINESQFHEHKLTIDINFERKINKILGISKLNQLNKYISALFDINISDYHSIEKILSKLRILDLKTKKLSKVGFYEFKNIENILEILLRFIDFDNIDFNDNEIKLPNLVKKSNNSYWTKFINFTKCLRNLGYKSLKFMPEQGIKADIDFFKINFNHIYNNQKKQSEVIIHNQLFFNEYHTKNKEYFTPDLYKIFTFEKCFTNLIKEYKSDYNSNGAIKFYIWDYNCLGLICISAITIYNYKKKLYNLLETIKPLIKQDFKFISLFGSNIVDISKNMNDSNSYFVTRNFKKFYSETKHFNENMSIEIVSFIIHNNSIYER